MLGSGQARDRLATLLNHAFAEGLLSQHTHAYRIDQLFEGRLVNQGRLVGDLTLRRPPRGGSPNHHSGSERLGDARQALAESVRALSTPTPAVGAPLLLELDQAQGDHLLLGRSSHCDVVIEDPWVSRRHAQLVFRDGIWTIQDLSSTNGTLVNGAPVGRMTLRQGDTITLGRQTLLVD